MKGSKLYIRIINLLLIVIILLYYNSSMKTYALEEKKDKIQAELDAEKNYSSGLLEEMQEVLGVSGLMGAGRTEIMQAIFGNMPHVTGEIFLNGKQIENKTPKQAMKNGIGFITEDRKVEGLMLEESIMKNISLANLKRISRHGVIQREKEKELVKKGIEELHIRCFGPQHECNNLSGGNQQKVVFAKWMYTNPKVLILDEPTRGVDIGAKKEIYSIVNDLAAKGVAIIMVSSELPEVLGMSDRVMVVREGLVRGFLSKEEANQENIMILATGGNLNE